MRTLNRDAAARVVEAEIRKEIKNLIKQSKNIIIGEMRKSVKAGLNRELILTIAEKIIEEQISQKIKISNIMELLHGEVQKKTQIRKEYKDPDKGRLNNWPYPGIDLDKFCIDK